MTTVVDPVAAIKATAKPRLPRRGTLIRDFGPLHDEAHRIYPGRTRQSVRQAHALYRRWVEEIRAGQNGPATELAWAIERVARARTMAYHEEDMRNWHERSAVNSADGEER